MMNKGITDFPTKLASVAAETESLLKRLLGDAPIAGEILRPPRLVAAMRHAALDGGKRLRPFLLVETATVFGAARADALMASAALELVHCYSLVHDDLPAMDDDDLRRGRPTVHKAFDEATAILVGDALLTLAFDVMARSEVHADPAVRVALVAELARASGLGGMAGGQMLDLAAEGRFEPKRAMTEKNFALIEKMDEIAKAHSATISQVALAWMMAPLSTSMFGMTWRGGTSFPIHRWVIISRLRTAQLRSRWNRSLPLNKKRRTRPPMIRVCSGTKIQTLQKSPISFTRRL